MAIGDYLKNLREKRGLSIREAARRVGISYTRLQELERGISRTTGKPTSPSTEILIKIAKGYEQPIPVLLEMAGLSPVSQDEHQEAELIKVFRELSPKGRELALALVRTVEAQERL